MSDLNEKMEDLIRRIKSETAEKQAKMEPTNSQLKPTLKQFDKWNKRNEPKPFVAPTPKSSIEMPKNPKALPSPNTNRMTKADWDGMEMRANLRLTMIKEQLHALQTDLFLEDAFYEYIEDEFKALLEAVNDVTQIVKLDVDKTKMSEQGVHEYEHFLKKREQLLLKFKK